MSKAADALGWIRIAGYHNDTTAFVRLYCEHRISYPTAIKSFREGQAAKKSGMKCSCRECSKAA